MDRQVKEKNMTKLVSQRNAFLFFSALLAIAVMLQAILLCTKKERIVVIPTSGPSYWIEDQRASSVYLEKMGIFLSDLLLNRSAADVEQRNRIILQYVHPSSYQEFKSQLAREEEMVLKNGQTFFFRTYNTRVDPAATSFIIQGESDVWIEKEGAESFAVQKLEKKYTLHFRCEQGKLLLESLKQEIS